MLTARQRQLHFPSVSLACPWADNEVWRAEIARWNAEADDRIAVEAQRRRLRSPGWSYDAKWLTFIALEFLPAVCVALGTGPAVASLRPKWWPEDEPGHVLALRATPNAGHLLFIDRASGFWWDSVAARRGADFVELGSWRWGVTRAKAAWRLARTCGLRRTLP